MVGGRPGRGASWVAWATAALALVAAATAPGARAQDLGHDGTWFSPLADLDASGLRQLDRVTETSLGSPRGQAGAVAQAGALLVVQTPFPHTVLALAPAETPPERWRFAPPADRMAAGLACCSAGRQPVVVAGKVVLGTLDGHVIALDGGSGTVLWDHRVANPGKGEILSGEPVAAGGLLVIGNGAEASGSRGWIAALDAGDGHEVWRRFSTGPDAEVGIGPGFSSVVPGDRGPDRGVETWPPQGYEQGGGAVTGPIVIDEEAGLLVHGIGRPLPADPLQRPGDNLWTSGLMARSVADGSVRWFVGLNRGDPFGYGANGPIMLVDRDWQGARRSLVLHADANGLFYVIDRRSGEVLAADAYQDVTAHDGLDMATGLLRVRPDKAPRTNRVSRDICPDAATGLKGGAAYSPQTGLAYIAVDRMCMDLEVRRTGFIAGTLDLGANISLRPPGEGPRGELVAWDVAARRRAWAVPEDFPVAGGVLATAGGLVFYGTLDGQLKALDARTGQALWSRRLPAGTVAQPIAFTGSDGHEAIAVLSGLPGPLGVPSDLEVDVRDATAASGTAHGLPDLPSRTGQGASLSVFGLRP